MRLLLKLKAVHNSEFPFNYNYQLSAAIYKLLAFGSKEFSAFLHDTGYKSNGKTYKLFTFALRFENAPPKENGFHLSSRSIDLYISTPRIDDFIKNFVFGTFENKYIDLCFPHKRIYLLIDWVGIIQPPEFKDEMKFTLYSPLVLSTKHQHDGKLNQYYLRYNDSLSEINRILTQNLINKYQLLSLSSDEIAGNVELRWDQKYIDSKTAQNKRLTVKTMIDVSDRKQEIIGNMLPFSLSGPVELIRTGYECGFGEKNSMGFGLAEASN